MFSGIVCPVHFLLLFLSLLTLKKSFNHTWPQPSVIVKISPTLFFRDISFNFRNRQDFQPTDHPRRCSSSVLTLIALEIRSPMLQEQMMMPQDVEQWWRLQELSSKETLPTRETSSSTFMPLRFFFFISLENQELKTVSFFKKGGIHEFYFCMIASHFFTSKDFWVWNFFFFFEKKH